MSGIIKAIVIGGSAGSFSVVSEILSGLPSNFDFPIFICMHRLKNIREGFVEALQLKSKLQIKEPLDKEKIKNGIVYLAPSNYHMNIEVNKTISLSTEEMVNFSRPSIDLTFQTAGYAYKNKIVGIILSGANKDGALGLKKVKNYGGISIIQNIKECMVATMPKSAKKVSEIDYELTTDEITKYLIELHKKQTKKIAKEA